MSLRKGSKIIVTVGFLICFSCMGILYSNLSSTTTESNSMLNIKNRAIEQLKRELEDRDTKTFTLENRILSLERESTQCSDEKVRVEKKSQTLEQSLDELRAKAADVNANLHKLELREEEEKTNHRADLKENLDTLEGLKIELRNEQGSKASLVADLGVMKGQLNQAQSEAEQQSIALTKCLQGAGQADIKVADPHNWHLQDWKRIGDQMINHQLSDSEKEDVGQHQVQAPVQQEAAKPQAVVDSVDHNAPAPVPAQQAVVGGGTGLGDQIAALPKAVAPPRGAANDEDNQQQQVGAAPPPLQPAQPAQHDQFQVQPAQPAPAQEVFQPLAQQPLQPLQQDQPALPQPALPQEVQAAPQHP